MTGYFSAVLVFAVEDVSPSALGGWTPGPWPVPLPFRYFPALTSQVADRPTREDYFDPTVHHALYGDGQGGPRWWRPGQGESLGEWVIEALEYLAYPGYGQERAGLLAMHLDWSARRGEHRDGGGPDREAIPGAAGRQPEPDKTADPFLTEPPDPVTRLRQIRWLGGYKGAADGQAGRAAIELVQQVIGSVLAGAHLVSDRTQFLISHLVSATGGTVPPGHEKWAEGEGTPVWCHWSRALAAANDSGALSASLRPTGIGAHDWAISDDWGATILRSGAAFVGATSLMGADGSPAGTQFHRMASALVHSVYLDVFLLSLLQRDCLRDISASLVRFWKSPDYEPATALGERAMRMRSELWWVDVSPQANPNEIIARTWSQFNLPEQMARLREDIEDVVAFAGGRRSERINTMLNILVAVSAGTGVAALIADPGAAALMWGVVTALAIALLLWRWPKRRG